MTIALSLEKLLERARGFAAVTCVSDAKGRLHPMLNPDHPELGKSVAEMAFGECAMHLTPYLSQVGDMSLITHEWCGLKQGYELAAARILEEAVARFMVEAICLDTDQKARAQVSRLCALEGLRELSALLEPKVPLNRDADFFSPNSQIA